MRRVSTLSSSGSARRGGIDSAHRSAPGKGPSPTERGSRCCLHLSCPSYVAGRAWRSARSVSSRRCSRSRLPPTRSVRRRSRTRGARSRRTCSSRSTARHGDAGDPVQLDRRPGHRAQHQVRPQVEPDTCGKTDANYCDITLVNVVPGDFYDTAAGGVEFSIGGAVPGTDLDLFVYESDAAGNAGEFVGASAGATDAEARLDHRGDWLLPRGQVVYFNATNTGYAGRAEFFRRNQIPADVDDPRACRTPGRATPGAASGPTPSRTSSQDPTDAKVLVGGLEDVQPRPRLAGRVRVQDRHLRVIRSRAQLGRPRTAEHLPPGAGATVIVAAEQHLLSGRRPEPRRHRSRGRGRGSRPDGDFGEEYITSDVWTDFDDEGNAYAMVLDSPPFPSGNGWGMSFHRWETPSASDIRRGRTWSKRIPINAYPTVPDQATKLDDKNTFAVNNAGRDHDGKTGHHRRLLGPELRAGPVRAPGGGVRALARRRPHLARPTTADLAAAGSGLPFGPFVIGVHVVAERDATRNTFYAVWLDTLTGFLDGSGTSPFWFTKTTDGAQTWEPARIIGRIQPAAERLPAPELPQPVAADHGGGQAWRAVRDLRRLQPGTVCRRGRGRDAGRHQAHQLVRRWRDVERPDEGQQGPLQRRPVPALRARDPARAGERVVLRPAPGRARPAEPPGQLLHRHVPRAVQQRGARRGGRRGCRTTRGIRPSTRRSPGRASSSATTRDWSPTTASRSRSSTTPTWPTTRPEIRTSTTVSRAARTRRSSPGGCPTRARSADRATTGAGAVTAAAATGARWLREAGRPAHRCQPRRVGATVPPSAAQGTHRRRGTHGRDVPESHPLTERRRPAPITGAGRRQRPAAPWSTTSIRPSTSTPPLPLHAAV